MSESRPGIAELYPVTGLTAPGFEPVRAAFERNFAEHGEIGAALHVTIEGETVVDLWGGAADQGGTRAWTPETLVNVWSSTKGWLALAMHMLADRGEIDLDAPVAAYWPEFAQNGKGGVLLRHVLSHTSGLPAPSMRVPDDALYDWGAMVRALERSALYWEPGNRCGYHAATFGWLNGEVLRRVTGLSAGAYLRSRVADPLGADAFVGLTGPEQERTAETIPYATLGSALGRLAFRAANSLGGRARRMACRNPPRPPEAANTRRWREAEIPSSNGHSSARGLARIYAPLASEGEAGGVRLLSAKAVERAAREAFHGRDVVTGGVERRTLGFALADPDRGDPRPASAFGHAGMGGSIGFAEPTHRLAFGYVMNRMLIGADPRWAELCRAVYACLGSRRGA